MRWSCEDIMNSSEGSVSRSRPVLPPITSHIHPDQSLVSYLQEVVDQEISSLPCPALASHTCQERYAVYCDVFGKIVGQCSGYCPLLSAIKAEFEECIETIQRGQHEAFYLSGKVKTMAAEQTTRSLYMRRADQLKQIMSVVESDNALLQKNLEAILAELNSHTKVAEDEEVVKCVTQKQYTTTNRLLPGFTLEESVDFNHLYEQMSNLEVQVKDLHLAKQSRYTPRAQKEHLTLQLASKIKAKDHVTEKNTQLKARCRKLRVALEALRMYGKDPPLGQTAAEAIVTALTRSNSKMSSRSGETMSSTFDDDDPSKEREAEMLLEYIEHFNELFEEGRYVEAAMHAANSPKGILRNAQTLARFRAIQIRPNVPSALLAYCEALMSSVPAVRTLPNAETSLECVKSALVEDRLDLVLHWLAQKRLTCSEPLGHLLYNYTKGKRADVEAKCLPLAESVYVAVGAHIQAAVCMCKQGKVQAMMDYADNAKFEKDMYVGVLVACPSLPLAEVLIQPRNPLGRPVLQVNTVVYELLKMDHYEIGMQLLKKMHQGVFSASLKDLVFSNAESAELWSEVVQRCQDSGLYDIGLELLAAITVLQSMQKATQGMPT